MFGAEDIPIFQSMFSLLLCCHREAKNLILQNEQDAPGPEAKKLKDQLASMEAENKQLQEKMAELKHKTEENNKRAESLQGWVRSLSRQITEGDPREQLLQVFKELGEITGVKVRSSLLSLALINL